MELLKRGISEAITTEQYRTYLPAQKDIHGVLGLLDDLGAPDQGGLDRAVVKDIEKIHARRAVVPWPTAQAAQHCVQPT